MAQEPEIVVLMNSKNRQNLAAEAIQKSEVLQLKIVFIEVTKDAEIS